MESSGLPGRVHCSEATRAALLSWPGFSLECRGELEVKGKPRMKTYWVLGETGLEGEQKRIQSLLS